MVGKNRSSQNMLTDLIVTAEKNGATVAKIIDVKNIAVDKRVRLKCAVPQCQYYNRHLLCPPNLMPVDEFESILKLYRKALILQIEANVDSTDKSKKHLDFKLCKELEAETGKNEWVIKLHKLVNLMETYAFKQGFYLAAGLIGGQCHLCEECVLPQSGQPCRRPFEARPSMEAMGIDVWKTCQNVGLPLKLTSKDKVRWTGLVLLY